MSIDKLSTLLDDPEVRELIFGSAHVASAPRSAGPGASRLHAVVLCLADVTSAEQYGSWLSDDTPNQGMTLDQVRMAPRSTRGGTAPSSAGTGPPCYFASTTL